jgi:formiminotetrahydrofolate cyclodeaminase
VIGSNKNGPLASMPLCDFIKSLGSRTPSPGGGSGSAAVAAIVRVVAKVMFDVYACTVYRNISRIFSNL